MARRLILAPTSWNSPERLQWSYEGRSRASSRCAVVDHLGNPKKQTLVEPLMRAWSQFRQRVGNDIADLDAALAHFRQAVFRCRSSIVPRCCMRRNAAIDRNRHAAALKPTDVLCGFAPRGCAIPIWR